jgi:hypothetical protein
MSHLLVGEIWALVLIAPGRMQIAMLLLMGRMLAQWLGSMDRGEIEIFLLLDTHFPPEKKGFVGHNTKNRNIPEKTS